MNNWKSQHKSSFLPIRLCSCQDLHSLLVKKDFGLFVSVDWHVGVVEVASNPMASDLHSAQLQYLHPLFFVQVCSFPFVVWRRLCRCSVPWLYFWKRRLPTISSCDFIDAVAHGVIVEQRLTVKVIWNMLQTTSTPTPCPSSAPVCAPVAGCILLHLSD